MKCLVVASNISVYQRRPTEAGLQLTVTLQNLLMRHKQMDALLQTKQVATVVNCSQSYHIATIYRCYRPIGLFRGMHNIFKVNP